ncbi:MAG: hypothetical protein NTY53_17585 [Kiritimatiellaeota bacterium]|nr:hypothetical protein [Kiritimatiellota bacterium]
MFSANTHLCSRFAVSFEILERVEAAARQRVEAEKLRREMSALHVRRRRVRARRPFEAAARHAQHLVEIEQRILQRDLATQRADGEIRSDIVRLRVRLEHGEILRCGREIQLRICLGQIVQQRARASQRRAERPAILRPDQRVFVVGLLGDLLLGGAGHRPRQRIFQLPRRERIGAPVFIFAQPVT